MADGEKPTSIWKKELSFRRKPDEATAADAPAEPGSSSIWKKEISLRKREAEPEQVPEPSAPVVDAPDLDAAIAALSVPAEPEPGRARAVARDRPPPRRASTTG